MAKGTVKWFNDEKGFGFINSEHKDYFVYFKDIQAEGFKSLKQGASVEFTPDTTQKGPVARDVKLAHLE